MDFRVYKPFPTEKDNLTLLYMLKSKSKTPKTKAPKKKVSKPKHFKKNKHHKTKQTIETPGHFIPTQTNAIQSHAPQIHHQMTGGIPYTSTLETFGVSNKPPYFLESLIAKSSPMTYSMPVASTTSTTITGSNTMTESKPKMFEEQTKPTSVDYVDLVEPFKKGNKETQPDYILLNDDNSMNYGNENDDLGSIRMINDRVRRKRRTQKEMHESKQMKEEEKLSKQMNKETLKPKPETETKTRGVQEIRQSIEERIKKNKEVKEGKEERKTKIPSLRGKKKSEEL